MCPYLKQKLSLLHKITFLTKEILHEHESFLKGETVMRCTSPTENVVSAFKKAFHAISLALKLEREKRKKKKRHGKI